MPQQNQYDEDMGYRTMTREDVAILQERRISSNVMSPQPTSPMTPQQNNVPAPPAMPVGAPSPVSPPQGAALGSRDGHQRTVSAPPAPPPPPGPPAGPVAAAAPPPPPPPPMNMSRSQSSDGGEVNSLAAQLQNARLKRNNKVGNSLKNKKNSKKCRIKLFAELITFIFRIPHHRLKIVDLQRVAEAVAITGH